MSDKAVITCALNGVLTDPKQHNVPVTPEQMAREARAAFNAGASIMHIHLRQQAPGKGDSTPQDGKCPLPGACWRRWICMMLAPALNAALASRAICSGVTGTLCCFGSVSTPFSAQVMTALSLMPKMSRTLRIQRLRS